MGTFAYFPHTDEDIRVMLERIGVKSLDDLYADVPAEFVFKKEYDLPEALSEQQVRERFAALASKNVPLTVFAGAGAYDHYTPSVIEYLTSRSEFLTAYTPYQSEISQGTLRYIFEFQSMICALTGMDVSNASMYDGPTAAAEAVRMCVAAARKKNSVAVSGALLPNVLETIRTYARYSGVRIIEIAPEGGRTTLEGVRAALGDEDVAGVLVPSVNRYGIIEDLGGFASAAHEAKALLAEYCDPSALAVLKTPAGWGADIAVGDGQSLGIPLSYGGPYVGFMACTKDLMRKLPGRIVGQTSDVAGKRCYVLTLQAREQHIRREKATSNICSNQSLMALWVTIYLSLMGPEGMKEVNSLSSAGAHYLKARLLETGRFEDPFPDAPFLKEFALKPLADASALQKALLDAGFFGAIPAGDGLVTFCVTEKRSRQQIDELVKTVKEAAL